MEIAVFLVAVFFGFILVGAAAFICLAAYVGWTGYTHVKQDED
jgi:hypothetical protein